jgi:membrane protein YdbS with pleckstrin-like domain
VLLLLLMMMMVVMMMMMMMMMIVVVVVVVVVVMVVVVIVVASIMAIWFLNRRKLFRIDLSENERRCMEIFRRVRRNVKSDYLLRHVLSVME